MKTIIAFFVLLLFCGCQQTANQNTDNTGSDSSKSTEQLKQDVLNAACTNEMKQDFEEEIDSQSKTLNDEQLRNSLLNMKANTKCAK